MSDGAEKYRNPNKTYNERARFMIAHIIGDIATGDEFVEFPAHVTFMPWVETTEPEALVRFIRVDSVIGQLPVDLRPLPLGDPKQFGEAASPVMARQPEDNSWARYIHGVVMGVFADLSPDRRYLGGVYNPHVTLRGDSTGPLQIVIDSLCLIRHCGDHKKIVGAERWT